MLRALMKKKELDKANSDLKALREAATELEKRYADIEKMIEEAETEEERTAVEGEVEKFEADKRENEEAIKGMEEKVGEIEKELAEIEEGQEPAPADPAPAGPAERKEHKMINRRNIFNKMDEQKRTAILEQEDVKSFLAEVRSAMKEQRSITGEGLLVPEVFIGLIRENVENFSKLYRHVNLRVISGNGREVVEGTIPEAVWTDCCANVNELGLTFNETEVFCWNVGGYIPVCRSTLEDSDIDLASEIIAVLGQAIGYALDKAILYGTGTRMPQGIVTRLAQTAQPADYPANARTWKDLHASNIVKTNETGVKLFQDIVTKSAAAKGNYSRGEMVWVMNEATYTYLKAQGLSVNAAGAIVSGIEGSMPVAGGIVEVLPFVPDNNIIAGYFDLYLLAERGGITIEESDHVMFLNRKRVYMANARYDGKPVIAEGFVTIGVQNATPTTTMTFAADTANASE